MTSEARSLKARSFHLGSWDGLDWGGSQSQAMGMPQQARGEARWTGTATLGQQPATSSQPCEPLWKRNRNPTKPLNDWDKRAWGRTTQPAAPALLTQENHEREFLGLGQYYPAMGLPKWCQWQRSRLPVQERWDLGSVPGLGRSPGEGHGNPLQYSHLKNPDGQRSLAGCSP